MTNTPETENKKRLKLWWLIAQTKILNKSLTNPPEKFQQKKKKKKKETIPHPVTQFIQSWVLPPQTKKNTCKNHKIDTSTPSRSKQVLIRGLKLEISSMIKNIQETSNLQTEQPSTAKTDPFWKRKKSRRKRETKISPVGGEVEAGIAAGRRTSAMSTDHSLQLEIVGRVLPKKVKKKERTSLGLVLLWATMWASIPSWNWAWIQFEFRC